MYIYRYLHQEKEKITIQSAEGGERKETEGVRHKEKREHSDREDWRGKKAQGACGTWRGGQRVVQRERENERTKIVFTRVMESAVVNTILFYIQPSGKQSQNKISTQCQTHRERRRHFTINDWCLQPPWSTCDDPRCLRAAPPPATAATGQSATQLLSYSSWSHGHVSATLTSGQP